MKANNPHTWFYAYLKTIDGHQQYGDIIKESIVSEYSGGLTESLSVLYNDHRHLYEKMRTELTKGRTWSTKYSEKDIKPKVYNADLDKARKRLIAVLFDCTGIQGYKKDIQYIKKIACTAAGVKQFNDIPLEKLRELYRKFGKKKAPLLDKWAGDVLNKISEGV